VVWQYLRTAGRLVDRLIDFPEYGRSLGESIVRVLLQFLLCLFLVDRGDFFVECLGERGFGKWEVNDSLALVVVSYVKPAFTEIRIPNGRWGALQGEFVFLLVLCTYVGIRLGRTWEVVPLVLLCLTRGNCECNMKSNLRL